MVFEVFLSHAKEDFTLVERIFNILKRIQINCYVYELFPQYGEYVPEIIKNRIFECHDIICFLTKNGIESQWVNQEIGIAHAYGKLIIPIVEEGIESEGFVELRQYISYNASVPEEPIYQIIYRLRTLFPDKYLLELECEKCNAKFSYIMPSSNDINDAIRKNVWFQTNCYKCGNYVTFNPKTLEQKVIYDSYQSQKTGFGFL